MGNPTQAATIAVESGINYGLTSSPGYSAGDSLSYGK